MGNDAYRLFESRDSPTSRSAGAFRAPRKEDGASRPSGKTASGTRSQANLYLRISLFSDHQLPARVVSRLEALGPGGGPRFAAVRRGRFGIGQHCRRERRRTGDDRRGVGQGIQRLDENDFPLAAARAGQPAVRDGRPEAGRISAKFGARNSSSRTATASAAARSSASSATRSGRKSSSGRGASPKPAPAPPTSPSGWRRK